MVLSLLLLLPLLPACAAAARAAQRGWNSFDATGGCGNETQILAVADFMAQHLLPYGYDLITLDGGWQASTDAYGLPVPDATLFPSTANGAGFRPLSDVLKSKGLRLGLWQIKGISTDMVAARGPIKDSPYTADQAASQDHKCTWDTTHLGVQDNPAGRAYYRSVAAVYASWGVSFVKVDCMVGDGYHGRGERVATGEGGTEWLGLSADDFTAFAAATLPLGIQLSVSPGWSMNVRNATYLSQLNASAYIQYRISQDMGDLWQDSAGPHFFYPTGVKGKLDLFPLYSELIGVGGTFPDGDMLPLSVVVHLGTDLPPSPTRLTPAEQQLAVTLWVVARAPLILGGRLPLEPSDKVTLPLLTNPEVLAVHNASHGNAPVPVLGGGVDLHAWRAFLADSPGNATTTAIFALFNGRDVAARVAVDLPGGGSFCIRDLWARKNVNVTSATLSVALEAHSAGLFSASSPSACKKNE